MHMVPDLVTHGDIYFLSSHPMTHLTPPQTLPGQLKAMHVLARVHLHGGCGAKTVPRGTNPIVRSCELLQRCSNNMPV